MSRGTVAVGLSGGVDSSAAVALLLEAGYECIGVTMRHLPAEAANSCCSLESVVDARRVAKKFKIPHYLVDVEETFRERVIEPFEQAYLSGVTPNPCALCNRYVKFGKLWEWAQAQGADYIATGHYARIVERDGVYQLWRARDLDKDQSYLLYSMTQRDLEHILFPLGEMTKAEAREVARAHELRTADKPDSQELCFVPGNDYRQYLEEHRPEAARPGDMVDTTGKVVGQHRGIAFYTVGQRKGLGVSAPVPLYVVGVTGAANQVVVGTREEVIAQGAWVSGVNYPDGVVPAPFVGETRIRAHGEAQRSEWIPEVPDRARVVFPDGAWAVTPGQVAVSYRGEHLVAGGRIDSEIRDAL